MPCNNIIRVIKSRRIRSREHVKQVGFWWRNLRDRDHVEDPGVDGKIILRWIFRKWDGWTWIGLIWLGIGTGGGHLLTWQWTFGFRKMRGISLLAENRLASQEGLCFMEYVINLGKDTDNELHAFQATSWYINWRRNPNSTRVMPGSQLLQRSEKWVKRMKNRSKADSRK